MDPVWSATRVLSGLSSGEGVINAVRDPIVKREAVKERGRIVDYQDVEIDSGIDDKRLLVFESELANVLRVIQRDGNTLSPLLRDAWDGRNLQLLTKNNPSKATNPHISIVAHITLEELRHYMNRTELVNGLANRFMWFGTRRSKCLPEGGNAVDYNPFIEQIQRSVEFARKVEVIERDSQARELWKEVYSYLSDGKPGIFGAAIARAEAHVMRIAMLYALIDRSDFGPTFAGCIKFVGIRYTNSVLGMGLISWWLISW